MGCAKSVPKQQKLHGQQQMQNGQQATHQQQNNHQNQQYMGQPNANLIHNQQQPHSAQHSHQQSPQKQSQIGNHTHQTNASPQQQTQPTFYQSILMAQQNHQQQLFNHLLEKKVTVLYEENKTTSEIFTACGVYQHTAHDLTAVSVELANKIVSEKHIFINHPDQYSIGIQIQQFEGSVQQQLLEYISKLNDQQQKQGQSDTHIILMILEVLLENYHAIQVYKENQKDKSKQKKWWNRLNNTSDIVVEHFDMKYELIFKKIKTALGEDGGIEQQVEEAGKEVINFLEDAGKSIWNVFDGGNEEEKAEDESPQHEQKAQPINTFSFNAKKKLQVSQKIHKI